MLMMRMVDILEKKMILYGVKKLSSPNWTISSSLLAKRYSTNHPTMSLHTYIYGLRYSKAAYNCEITIFTQPC